MAILPSIAGRSRTIVWSVLARTNMWTAQTKITESVLTVGHLTVPVIESVHLAAKKLTEHAAVNCISYIDALIHIRMQERDTQKAQRSNVGSVEAETQTHQVHTSTPNRPATNAENKVSKEIQCVPDDDLPTDKANGSDSSSHITVETTKASTDTENKKATDVITHTDLYQLLAIFMQMSKDRSISRSTIIKTILTHVFNIIDRPHEDIKEAIHQYYSPPSADLSANNKSNADSKDQEKRAKTLRTKPVSEPKGSCKHANTK